MTTPEQSVALLGPEGSFHRDAADQLLDNGHERIGCDNFEEIIGSLADGQVDSAVIAYANSEIGALNETYDLLGQHECYIAGEVYLRIRHQLMGLPGSSLDQVETVLSNPKALAQCDAFLAGSLPAARRVEGQDTATCAQQVAESGDPTVAAIGSQNAAETYGLEVLAPGIETKKDNYTRFLLLRRELLVPEDADKTTMVLHTPNESGALVRALNHLANEGINLTSLVSRPSEHRDDPWAAKFYVDAETSALSPEFQTALARIQGDEHDQVQILGSYRSGQHVE